MSLALRTFRRAGVAAAVAGMVLSVSTVLAPLSESSGTTVVVATAGVNIRSGPGTKYSIVGSLARGGSITALGPSEDGWTPVSVNGVKRWISSQYLTVKDQPAATTPAGTAGSTTATTTAALNARTGAGLKYRVSVVLAKGTRVTLTGRTSGEWRQISRSGVNLWVSARYLSASGAASSGGTPAGTSAGSSTGTGSATSSTSTAATTAALNARTGDGLQYRVAVVLAKGTTVSLTGRTSGEWRQITHSGQTLWVSGRYLATAGATSSAGAGSAPATGGTAQPVAVAPPEVTGTRYATADLNIRTASKGGSTVTVVPIGTALSITGVTENGRAQVVYQGAVRWVTAQYLSTGAPAVKDYSKGLGGLRSSASTIVDESRAKFPTISTYYGVRADSLPDHPSGRAVDIMIPGYRTTAGQALGQAVAEWLKANASRLNVEYVIWNQRIWSVGRSKEGWRFMADRGGDTANHKDHVHVTVRS